MTQWHYSLGDEAKGPVSDEQLKTLCEAGVLDASSLVWQPDFSDWKKLGDSDFIHKDVLRPPAISPSQAAPSAAPVAAAAAAAPAAGPGAIDWDQHWAQEAQNHPENLSLWRYFVRAITQKYVDFSGRARRKEYWGFILFSILCGIGAGIVGGLIDALTGNLENNGPVFGLIFYGIFTLAVFLPSLAVAARRLHDWNRSAWWMLIMLIPYIGGLVFFVFMLIDPTRGANRFGPSPLGTK